jgi:hypothetical protein
MTGALSSGIVVAAAERGENIGQLAWRFQFAGEPANGVCFQRVYRNGNFFDTMARAALKSSLLEAALAGRYSS